MFSDRKSSVLYRNLRAEYPSITRAEGVYLFDQSGKKYLDAVGGAGVNIIGHGVRAITDSIAENWESISYVYGATFTNPWQEELAETLVSISPLGDGRVFFTSGGSEANETAVKLARQYHLERGNPTKWKIVSRWQSYHGNTLAALSLSGRPAWREPYDPYLMSVPHIDPPYCFRCPYGKTYPNCGVACADDLERTILLEGPDTIAAFIAEPMIGTTLSGVVPVPEYYSRIREICDKYDVLFLADEILSGYGRTGKFSAIEHWNVRPDIITLGKGLASGYAPLAACIASEKVVDTLYEGSGEFAHSFTFSGMPISCFIGLEVYKYVEGDSLFERAAAVGSYLHQQLGELADKHSIIGDVRGLGLYAGIEFVRDKTGRRPFNPKQDVTGLIVRSLAASGVLVLPGVEGANYGQDGDHIQISPPYVITETEIDRVVTALDESIERATAQSQLAEEPHLTQVATYR